MTGAPRAAGFRDDVEWRHVPLVEIATIDRKAAKANEISGRELYVGLENITSNGEFERVAAAREAGLKSTKFAFTKVHILYGKLRPYLAKIAAPNFEGICSTDILPIRPGARLDRRYLLHYLRTPGMVAHAASKAVGINLPRLNPKILESFEVPLPSIQEQRRIASVLDVAEELRAKRRQALARLNSLTQAIFFDMFGAGGSEEKPLGRLAEVQGGLQVTAKRKGHPIHVPYLRVANVYRGSLDLSEVKILQVSEKELARARLAEGDLLVVEGHGNKDEVGRVGIWNGSIDPCVHQNHLIRVRCDRSQLHPRFAEAFMNSWVGRRALLRAANTTSGLNTISTRDVRGVQIPLPALSDQNRFVEAANHVDRQRTILTTAGAELDELIASLQQRAFRGEL